MRLVMVLIAAQPIMAPEVAGSRSQSRARRRRAVSQARVRHGGEDGAGPADELAGEAAAGEDESQHPSAASGNVCPVRRPCQSSGQ
jgi:hypothetical protein